MPRLVGVPGEFRSMQPSRVLAACGPDFDWPVSRGVRFPRLGRRHLSPDVQSATVRVRRRKGSPGANDAQSTWAVKRQDSRSRRDSATRTYVARGWAQQRQSTSMAYIRAYMAADISMAYIRAYMAADILYTGGALVSYRWIGGSKSTGLSSMRSFRCWSTERHRDLRRRVSARSDERTGIV
jgi:hypothetical protein